LLVAWIVVEVAIIREFSALQAIYAAAGVGLVAIGGSAMLRQVASTVVVLPALLMRNRSFVLGISHGVRPETKSRHRWPGMCCSRVQLSSPPVR
jgi:hypothetical protein